MIYLSKILPLFVLPIGVTLILIVAGLVFRRRWLLQTAAIVLWISSTPLMARGLGHAIEGGAVRVPVANVVPADAIVALSTGRVAAPGPEHVSEWTDADRFFAGIGLLRAQKAPVLVFTGGAIPWAPGDPLEGDILAAEAAELGIPRNQILTTGRVFNTAEEAVAVAALLKARQPGPPHIILVTSAFHVPRATLLFERAGLVVTPFPVDFIDASGSMTLLDLLPSAGALAQTQVALREFYGRSYYRLLAR